MLSWEGCRLTHLTAVFDSVVLLHSGTYNISQELFESGPLNITANISAGNLTEPVFAPTLVVHVEHHPLLDLAVWHDTCSVNAAGMLACTLDATNRGNVGLLGLNVAGDAFNCSFGFLAVNHSVSCSAGKPLTQEQLWYGGSVDISVPYNVTPSGYMSFLELSPPTIFSVDLSMVAGFNATPPVLSLSVMNNTVEPNAVYAPGEG